MKGNKLIDDHVQIAINVARLKTHGRTFEVVIQPDEVVRYKQGEAIDVDELLSAQDVFIDAKKGEFASPQELKSIFDTEDVLVVAKKIIDNGEIQFTQKYREELRKQKFNRIVHLIHKHAINPQTKLPHPQARIIAAMDEAKVRIEDLRKAEDQVDEIVKKLLPIMPIKLALTTLKIHSPAAHAGRIRSAVEQYGKIRKEEWMNDGSLLLHLELPAGMQLDCQSELQRTGQGALDITVIQTT